MKKGSDKEKTGLVFVTVGTIVYQLGYAAVHIISAIVLFKQVKLWAFIVMLVVPVVGDIMAISTFFKIHYYLPLIAYGAEIVLYILVLIIGSAIENRRKPL